MWNEINDRVSNFPWPGYRALRHNPLCVLHVVTRHVTSCFKSAIELYASSCRFTLCMLIHSDARHRERKIGFYSFYRSNSSLRRLARPFISYRKTRKRGHRTAPTTNYFPAKRDDIFNLPRSTVWRNKVCMLSRNANPLFP